MGKVFAFHGGIHPPENKHQSTQSPIAKAPLPSVLHVPVQQHIGAPAKPCVNIGDKVLKGQRIGDAQGKVSVPIHAPSSGTVIAIEPHSVAHPSGMQGICISIETDGQETWSEHSALTDYKTHAKADLIDYIRDRGVAGMGGAGFPTAMKLQLGDDHIVNTLIINAAECEPYITADDLLMRERAEQIIAGIEILQHLLEPSHIIIGIENNKPQAIRALEHAISQCNSSVKAHIDVVSVPTKYPSGGEKQLIQLLTNVEVPHGGIPADVGIVCQNIGTVYAVYRAVCFGEPLISRIVTVTGEGVAKPQNYETLIGTPIKVLLESAGQYQQKISRLIMGGPMMGLSIDTDTIPIVKTSNCIIATTAAEMPSVQPEQACIRCGMCEQVCPVQLLPQQLHWFAKGQEFEKAQQHNLFDCIECGACSFVCPSNIPLVQYYRNTKTSIREEQQDKRKSDIARERFEAKQMREQRAIDEKAAKRKARAEQAALAQAQKQAASPAPTATNTPETELKKLNSAVTNAQEKVSTIQALLDKCTQEGNSELVAGTHLRLQKETISLQTAEQSVTEFKQQAAKLQKEGGEVVDLKKLKIGAALANTKLLKAQQALKKAQEKSQPGIEKLQQTIISLKQEAEQAADKYQAALGSGDNQASTTLSSSAASSAASDSSANNDSKKLKTAAAIARTKLKKAEMQLNKALLTPTPDVDEKSAITLLEHQVTQLQQAVEQAQALYQASLSQVSDISDNINVNANASANAQSAPANLELDIKKLKTAAAIARTKLKKAQAQLDKLTPQEQALAEYAELIAQIKALDEKVKTSETTYQQAKETTTKAKPEDNLLALQENYQKVQILYNKGLAALEKAKLDQNPAVEKMEISIDKLKTRYNSAKQALADAQANDNVSTTSNQE